MISPSAQALVHWLESTGTSKRALALDLGIDPSYLVHLVKGRRTPSLSVAYALADRCGIDPRTWRLARRTRRAA
jgi:transcriptional regulator with XRE-family HTH domain